MALASSTLSNAISASSANRTRTHSPLRRGFTTVSNHSSNTWCRKTFERQGEITPPCGEPLGRAAQETVFNGSCFQPFIDHPSDNAVRDSLVKERTEVGVRDRVEILAYVDVEHPVKTLGPQHVLQRAQRLVSRPSRPEAV